MLRTVCLNFKQTVLNMKHTVCGAFNCWSAGLSVATQTKLKTQDWAIKKPKKTQGQISIRFRKISEKNPTFPEKVIASDFHIFYPDFSNSDHFSPKTQGPFENPRKNPRPSEKTQEPKIASKNPRSWEKTQAVATLYVTTGNGRRYELSTGSGTEWHLPSAFNYWSVNFFESVKNQQRPVDIQASG